MDEPVSVAPAAAWSLEYILKKYPDLQDLPEAVLLLVGGYDSDTAGGCG